MGFDVLPSSYCFLFSFTKHTVIDVFVFYFNVYERWVTWRTRFGSSIGEQSVWKQGGRGLLP